MENENLIPYEEDRIFYNGNSNVKRDGIKIQWTREMMLEYTRCADDPQYFINNHMKVIELDRGLVPFQLRDYQSKVIDVINENRFSILLWCRQSGKTITTTSFLLWWAMFKPNQTIFVLANKGDTAREILARAVLGLENTPFYLQPGTKVLNKGSISFSNGSRILARATSSTSIRGASCVTGNTKICIKDEDNKIYYIKIDAYLRKLNQIKEDLFKNHIIYKITNIKTGKIYAGYHQTNDINDGYIGSGKSIKKAIEKYGIESFKKEILKIFKTKEEAEKYKNSFICERSAIHWFLSDISENKTKIKVLTQKGFQEFDGILDQGESDNLRRITFSDNSRIICTYDHKFLINNVGFIPASFLKPGDKLGDKYVSEIIPLEDSMRVYDLYNVKKTNSYITNGVVSHNCNVLYLDEFAFVQNAEQFYKSSYPVISSGKNTKVIVSSSAGNIGDPFQILWKGAISKTNDFTPLRVDWWEVPGRDEKWKEETIKNTSQRQFESEFGNSFYGSGLTLIDGNKLMMMRAAEPLFIERNGEMTIYEQPIPGHKYVIPVDVSQGRGQDYSTFPIIDISTRPFKQVATYRSNVISPLLLPTIIHKYANLYNEAFVIIESNDNGAVTSSILFMDLEYDNQFIDKRNGRTIPGLMMNKKVKSIGCSNLKDLIEENKLIIQDANTIRELCMFIAKGKSYEAEDGQNDDTVMSLVIFAWLTSTPFFQSLTDINIKEELYQSTIDEIMGEIVPFGIIDNGLNAHHIPEREIFAGEVWVKG